MASDCAVVVKAENEGALGCAGTRSQNAVGSEGPIGVANESLTLWKDADSDIPILKQAKTEYTKLE